jgi:hypothetical protein
MKALAKHVAAPDLSLKDVAEPTIGMSDVLICVDHEADIPAIAAAKENLKL